MAVQDKDKLVSLEDLKTAYDDLDGDISDVKNTLNHKADVIYDTVSGDIASFPDGADGLPVKDLTVGIEPVQDLHGYEYPWPGGGGKNLCPKFNPVSQSGITVTVADDGTLTINGTATAAVNMTITGLNIPAGTYAFSLNNPTTVGTTAGNSIYAFARDTNNSWVMNPVAIIANTYGFGTTEYPINAIVIVINSGVSVSNFVIKPQLELGSSVTPFTPYSNICPISGWTGANVGRAGFNIFDENDAEDGIWRTWSGGAGDKYDNAGYKRSKGYIPIKPNTQYYIIKNGETDGNIGFYDKNKTFLNKLYNFSSISAVFTTPSDALYMTIYKKTTLDGTCINISDESKNGTYEPYTGNTLIPISWQSEAGTVYGGTLDVTTGVLTVTDGYADLGTLSWGDQGTANTYQATISDILTPSNNIVCSHYPTTAASTSAANMPDKSIKTYGLSASKFIIIKDSSYSAVSDFALAMSGVQLVYELATPLVIQLDPITVTTLLGQNNIWADCGPSTVEYPCDTKLYIERLTAPEEDDMIADANIASGQYFIVNNNLYLSTASILAGDPIKPGTNCTLTNLAAALNALNS